MISTIDCATLDAFLTFPVLHYDICLTIVLRPNAIDMKGTPYTNHHPYPASTSILFRSQT